MPLRTSEVFGLNTIVSEHSYIDRGDLDGQITKLANRNQHISLKGESKCGKSWLRQKNFPDAIVVQCRIEFSPIDLYRSILGQLDIHVKVTQETRFGAGLEFSGAREIGWKLLAKAEVNGRVSGEAGMSIERRPIGKDEKDLEFISRIILSSGRRVVIEDFHYLDSETQRHLAHDLKAMWDYGVYCVIIGVWVKRNYLSYLNPDLAGRIREINVFWSTEDLQQVIYKGCSNLNVEIAPRIIDSIVKDSFENVGLPQSLTLGTLDECGITEGKDTSQQCTESSDYETAALIYAEQLEAVFLEFARRVSSGIRNRKKSTGIYAHAIWAVFDSTDDELKDGIHVDEIFRRANARQPRIQKGNLKSILPRIDELQVDDRGKGLVVSCVSQSDSVAVVDRSVLFYRKYSTVEWPWRQIATAASDEELEQDAD